MPNWPLLLLNENRWRAQRYGLQRGFIGLCRDDLVSSAELLDELLDLIGEDAAYFDSRDEVDHARAILARGTSADRQIALYRQEVERGAAPGDALRSVVSELVAETVGSHRQNG